MQKEGFQGLIGAGQESTEQAVLPGYFPLPAQTAPSEEELERRGDRPCLRRGPSWWLRKEWPPRSFLRRRQGIKTFPSKVVLGFLPPMSGQVR